MVNILRKDGDFWELDFGWRKLSGKHFDKLSQVINKEKMPSLFSPVWENQPPREMIFTDARILDVKALKKFLVALFDFEHGNVPCSLTLDFRGANFVKNNDILYLDEQLSGIKSRLGIGNPNTYGVEVYSHLDRLIDFR